MLVVLARPSPTTTTVAKVTATADVKWTRSGQLAGFNRLRPLALRQQFIGLVEPEILELAVPVATGLRADARQSRTADRDVINFRSGAGAPHFVK